MAYQPIENYGVIGDTQTVALVGMNGSIDWFCFPRFDSPSVFAAILDDQKGGYFKIAPGTDVTNRKQLYWPETNVLITRFLSPDGVAETTDYMPIGSEMTAPGSRQVARRVEMSRGSMAFRLECYPAFNYARDAHETRVSGEGAAFHAPGLSLGLASSVPLKQDGNGVFAEFTLQERETAVFLLKEIPCGAGCGLTMSEREASEDFKRTVEYWRRWISKCTYTGRWREMVHRSACVDGEDPRPSGRLQRLAPGAHREWRLQPTAVGHLWRADGFGLSFQQVRKPDLIGVLVGA